MNEDLNKVRNAIDELNIKASVIQRELYDFRVQLIGLQKFIDSL